MKKIIYLILLVSSISGCLSQNSSNSDKKTDSSIENEPLYDVYELTAVSEEGESVYFNIIYGVSFDSNRIELLDEEKKEDLKYFVKAIISSHTRGIIGKYKKEKISELKQIHSDLQDTITASLVRLNKSLEKDGIKIIKLDATMRNK